MPEKDLYKVLEVSRDASEDDIKKAYRKLAMKYHPDRNPDDKKAEERFKEISVAHGVLSDPEKRRLYDEFGLTGLREGFDPEQARRHGFQGGFPGTGVPPGGQGFEHFEEINVSDLFEQLFRGFGGFGSAPGVEDLRRGPMGSPFGSITGKGRDVAVQVEVGFMEAVRGVERSFEIELPSACPGCTGSGFLPGESHPCPDCGGSGTQSRTSWFTSSRATCGRCGGTGRVPSRPCPDCSGQGRVSARRTLRVRIPPGAQTGNEIRLKGRGEAGLKGGPAGDLVLRLGVAEHPHVRRQGDDLTVSLPVTVPEAYSGAKIRVPTPWETVLVTLPRGARTGQKLRVRGHGIRRKNGAQGDLYLLLEVQPPDRRDASTDEHVKALENAYGSELRSRNPFE